MKRIETSWCRSSSKDSLEYEYPRLYEEDCFERIENDKKDSALIGSFLL